MGNYGLFERRNSQLWAKRKREWATMASFEERKPTIGRERKGKPTLG
jgi:hypothetical protein